MFTSPTTIILGAGASYEFGAPLGAGLWARVARDTEEMRKSFEDFGSRQIITSLDQIIDYHRNKSPKAGAYFAEVIGLLEQPDTLDALMQAKNCAETFARNPFPIVEKIAARVAKANLHQSVDDFLRDNPSLLPPLRILMAGAIFETLYEQDKSRSSQWSMRKLAFTERFPLPHPVKRHPMVDNWLKRFVGACRPLLISAKLKVDPVTVISFNYDRLMETVLAHYWHIGEREFLPLSTCFKFIYPYGCFSEFPETVTQASTWLREQAQGVGLANGDLSPDAEIVRETIEQAEQIFAVGFSFTETNIALLGLKAEHGRKLFVQNYDDSDTRLARVLTRFPGAKSDAAPLAQLVSDGFFEQRGTETRVVAQD